MASQRDYSGPLKKYIIERIFFDRFDPETEEFFGSTMVTLDDISREINAFNAENPQIRRPLSPRNPANFFKDIVRNPNRNNHWPDTVLEWGYTGRAAVGGGNCFEFVPLPEDQDQAFPTEQYPLPTEDTPRRLLQSASLPLASRRLGRRDEPWLMQVAVALNLVETHLSLYSKIPDIQQVDHLQMNVKLGASEIDGLYLASYVEEGEIEEFIITVEAKGRGDDILPSQILGQVKAIASQPQILQDMIVPMAMKIVGSSQVYVVEYEVIGKDDAPDSIVEDLVIASDAVYELRPPVPGIS